MEYLYSILLDNNRSKMSIPLPPKLRNSANVFQRRSHLSPGLLSVLSNQTEVLDVRRYYVEFSL